MGAAVVACADAATAKIEPATAINPIICSPSQDFAFRFVPHRHFEPSQARSRIFRVKVAVVLGEDRAAFADFKLIPSLMI
jgi:hypothetical protein